MPDAAVWDRVMISAASMLSNLLRAHAAYYHKGGARERVEQIAWFCHWGDTPELLRALRADYPEWWSDYPTGAHVADYPEPEQIIAALLALHANALRRREERLARRAAAPQEPAADGDVGWDF